MIITCVSGFLGAAHDWDVLKAEIARQYPSLKTKIHWHNYSIIEGAKRIAKPLTLEAVAKDLVAESLKVDGGTHVLLGYSLGGRIGAAAIATGGATFEKFVVLGSRLVPLDFSAKMARKIKDLEWSTKILTMPWDQFLDQWNDQKVFEKSAPLFCAKPNAQELLLWAEVMRELTPASQQDLIAGLWHTDDPKIRAVKTYYVYGEHDSTYKFESQQLAKLGKVEKIAELANSGHRILKDNPAALASVLVDFLKLE